MPKQFKRARITLAVIGTLMHPALYAADETVLATVKVVADAEQIEQVSGKTLEKTQARNVAETFQYQNGMAIGGGGNPVAQKVFMRGLEDTMINVSVDGVTQNMALTHHEGRMAFDPALMKSIDIDKGTGSASAGPGALAGAIRATTKDARDLLRPGQSMGAQLGVGVFDNKGWRSSVSAYAEFDKTVDVLVSGSRQDLQSYRAGNGQEVGNSASDQDTLLAKASWRLGEQQTLSVSHSQQNDNGAYNFRPNMVGWDGNLPIPQDLKRQSSSLKYADHGARLLPKFDVNLYRSELEGMRTDKGRRYGEAMKNHGLDVAFVSDFGQHWLAYGVNYRRDQTRAINPLHVLTAGSPDSLANRGRESASVAGAYVEDNYQINGQWSAYGGLRFDRYRYEDNFGQEFDSQGASPSLALNYQITPAWKSSVRYARALRGVGVQEAFWMDNGAPDLVHNHARINAEKAQTVELSLAYAAGGWMANGQIFRQTIRDFIGTGGDDARGNIGKVVSDGYELSGGYQGGQWSGRLGVSQSKPKMNGTALADGDFGVGTTTGRSWLANLEYRPQANISAGWNARMVESLSYRAVGPKSAPDMRKAGYAVHDAYLQWQVTPALQIGLVVKNLLNKYYYDQATYAYNVRMKQVLGLAEVGRDVRLQANWKF
ncbi:TonB-dependent receptor domain-containing protein [Janthinobacterium sp.]|uniref:TonB-dependent receptor domain-containing protein n=1 Tax=Janthinobacterium sp. TaxID=1871054 RepID=UPI00293D41FB|nr:TonB-dependent receptor [Janthinobacterium sp.]